MNGINFPQTSSTRNRFDFDEESGDVESRLKKDNDSLLSDLSMSLRRNKISLTLMKDKLQHSNKSAEEIEGTFSKSFKVIKETMIQLNLVLKENSGLYCWLALFVFIVLFVIFMHTMLT